MRSYRREERCELIGRYIVKNKSTVRAAAKYFGISKSTVHKDVTERLFCIDPVLHEKVKVVLDKNKSERHIRGGEATKEKYLSISQLTRDKDIKRSPRKH